MNLFEYILLLGTKFVTSESYYVQNYLIRLNEVYLLLFYLREIRVNMSYAAIASVDQVFCAYGWSGLMKQRLCRRI